MKRLHHQSDAVAIWVKETKRQGRIAHHHADATVPHIVALLGFSFHAAKIQTISKICKFLANFFIIRYSPRKIVMGRICPLTKAEGVVSTCF